MVEELKNLFESVESESEMYQIIKTLLDKTDIELKTEIDKPLGWSAFSVLSSVIDDKKMNKSFEMLERFRELSFRYLLSYKRKSREEIIQALKTLVSQNTVEAKEIPPKEVI